MDNIMKFYKLRSFILCLLLANVAFATSPSVRLLSERHRTEWNWVEYRLALTNLSNSTLANPTIRYFAENPRIQYCKAHPNDVSCAGMQFDSFEVDSTLRIVVDDFTIVDSIRPKFYYNSKYTVVSLKFFGNIPSQATSTINFRIMRDQYPAWDCSHDYSFQQNANVQEEHYKMAVYDSDGKILWGSDPVTLQNDTVNVYWHDRSGTITISQYNGADSAKTFNERFWLLKGSPLSFEERRALDSIGAKLLETTRYQNKGLHLLIARNSISKKTLHKILTNFYNAFDADDTTHLSLKMLPKDFYEEIRSCDENDSCTTIVSARTSFDLVVRCWPDVQMNLCKNIVLNCGCDSAFIDRNVVLAKIPKDSIHCIERQKDIKNIQLWKEGNPENNDGRQTINLAELQNDSKWQQALNAPIVTTWWLKNAEYTGYGITVGVYDTGIDFTHPAFYELDALGNEVARKAPGYDDERTVANGKITKDDTHGTHVAGIIGGNGAKSETYETDNRYFYHGVAPKVSFLSDVMTENNQRGDVTNHSHSMLEYNNKSFYGQRNYNVDNNIFYDWKLPSEKGDFVTKTFIFSAGNSGAVDGFHSLTKEPKNAIVVGALNGFALRHSSSLGPSWDGRIKPDLMAPGSNVISSVPYLLSDNKYYDTKSGTSMAAPFVTGLVALLYQKFQSKTNTPLNLYSMRSSTTKALLIHSAADMHNCANTNVDIANIETGPQKCTPYPQGPDFATGWGRIDAEAALNLIEDYDINSKSFAKFREFSMYNGVQKRWNINVPNGKPSLRTTIVWDDAPGDPNSENYMMPKLVNDLDVYLISPSGRIYYPWRLEPLSIQNVDNEGNVLTSNRIEDRTSGLEHITFTDANKPASRHCLSIFSPSENCFDRLNNVEVVDVENPDPGVWQVVVKGYRVETGNSPDGRAQIASIVSDFPLTDATGNGNHPYAANTQTSEIIDLEMGCNQISCYLENYVTFGPETSLGEGDHIYLYDGLNRLIGSYSGNSLANKKIPVKSRFLRVVLDSNNDESQGWGYSISGIEHIPYGVLQILFPPYKKGE